MTLIIVTRKAKKVSFSSDSRISFGDNGYFDKGIKLFSVPMKLKKPLKSIKDVSKFEIERNFGIAVVGNSINAYTIKDTITETLSNITYLSNLSEVSLPSLGLLVCDVHKEISKELSFLGENGLFELILGGYCLFEKRVRILRVFYKIETEEIEYGFEEFLRDEKMAFYGSGKNYAQEIYNNDKTLEPLQIIKHVIKSKKCPKVGEALQYGDFYGKDFRILGVNEIEFDENGMLKNRMHFRRGSEVGKIEDEIKKPPYLAVSYSYKQVNIKPEKNKLNVTRSPPNLPNFRPKMRVTLSHDMAVVSRCFQ